MNAKARNKHRRSRERNFRVAKWHREYRRHEKAVTKSGRKQEQQ